MPKFEITRANGSHDYVISDSVENVRRDLLGEATDVRELTPDDEAEMEANAARRELEAREWYDVSSTE